MSLKSYNVQAMTMTTSSMPLTLSVRLSAVAWALSVDSSTYRFNNDDILLKGKARATRAQPTPSC